MQKESLPTQCPHCNHEPFSRPYHLQAHLDAQHSGVKRFQCDECDSLFTRASDLRVHLKERHLDPKKYPCKAAQPDGSVQGCHRVFAQKRSLLRHLRSDEGQSCRALANAVIARTELYHQAGEDDIVQHPSHTEAGELVSLETVGTLPTRSKLKEASTWDWADSTRQGHTTLQIGSESTRGIAGYTWLLPHSVQSADIFSYHFLDHNNTINLKLLAGNILFVARGMNCLYDREDRNQPHQITFLLLADIYHDLLQLSRKLCSKSQSDVAGGNAESLGLDRQSARKLLAGCVHEMRISAGRLGDDAGFRAHAAAETRLKPYARSEDHLRWPYYAPGLDFEEVSVTRLTVYGDVRVVRERDDEVQMPWVLTSGVEERPIRHGDYLRQSTDGGRCTEVLVHQLSIRYPVDIETRKQRLFDLRK